MEGAKPTDPFGTASAVAGGAAPTEPAAPQGAKPTDAPGTAPTAGAAAGGAGAAAPLRLADFDYVLPPERIAQTPAPRRDEARLLHVDRAGGTLAHRAFGELPALLRPGDLVVLNDTRVLPARLYGEKHATGGRVELLLVRRLDARGPYEERWEAMGRAAKPLRPGMVVVFAGGALAATVEVGAAARTGPGGGGLVQVTLRATAGAAGADVAALMERHGRLPLPPYIARDPDDPRVPELDALDRTRYQTVYAARPGAVAAPTAGLHFTEALLGALAGAGVGLATLTLHVGPGTFRPVRDDDPRAHRLDPERYDVPEATAQAVAAAGRVVAVGTTVARALEASGGRAGAGETDLYILPGHAWRVVGALVTNFHLPCSTLLMLVASLLPGWRAVYEDAVRSGYRFYSYGDAMFIE
jgi:S-adenosylmethionine:tRNA ribosyltransferase-isomerase